LAGPEKRSINCAGFVFFIIALKLPYLFPIFIKITPPSQSQQQSPCHIFDCPKIQGTKQNNNNESIDIREEITDEEVNKKGSHFKQEGEYTSNRMGCI